MVDFRKSPRLAELEYMSPKVAATSTSTHRFAVITFGVIGALIFLFII